MSVPEPQAPVALDAALGLAVVTVAAGVRTGRAVAGRLRPLADPQRWPWPMRALAEIGRQQRQAMRAEVQRRYRELAPILVNAVLDELDLPGIVNRVIDEIDLPEIIRSSTGSVAGDSVRDMRVQVMAADDAVSRWARWIATAGRDGKRPVAGQER